MEQSDQITEEGRDSHATAGMRAYLEGLTGPSKGGVIWLSEDLISILVGKNRIFRSAAGVATSETDQVATLRWSGDSYVLAAAEDRHIWVNGHAIESVHLMHGDMIEFDEHGPMCRFRLCERSFPAKWTIDEIIGDAFAYARSSRRPLPGRLSMAMGEILRRITRQTTIFFRITVIVALCLIVAFGVMLYQNDRKIEAMIVQDAQRIEAVTLLLTKTRDEALTDGDLRALQQQLETRLSQNTERLGALEQRSDAAARVIAVSAPSIAFVQGAFGLRHLQSGELLRKVLGPDGETLTTPFGQPRIEPNGNGPPAEFQFTGTGFLLENGQYLATNRHVALPWTSGDKARAFEQAGLQPEMLKLLVYFPDVQGPIKATLLNYSESSDVAVLSLAPARLEGRGLSLSPAPVQPGQELYLLGYPTGLKALLAQAGKEFVRLIGQSPETDFWTVAARLSENNLINPLASRGIVAQVSKNAVIYDAETTVGGSGGPALNRFGEVVAVNAAILPEFGGSNIGVPVSQLRALLNENPID